MRNSEGPCPLFCSQVLCRLPERLLPPLLLPSSEVNGKASWQPLQIAQAARKAPDPFSPPLQIAQSSREAPVAFSALIGCHE